MPAVEPILDHAAQLRVKGDLDGSLETYKKALILAGNTNHEAQASIYASIAEVKLTQGKKREAESNFEKALGVRPKHLRSIDGLIAIAKGEKEWDRVVTYRKKRVDAIDDADEKCAELCRIADVIESELKDAKLAAETLETALFHREADVGVLMKLKGLYTDLRAWTKLLDVLDQLVRGSEEPKHRGSFRFSQADVVLGRMRDEPRGIAFLEMALDEDPQCDRALSALVAVRTRREEWAELAAIYERLVDRHAGLGDRERAWEVCRRLGTIRRDRLLDGPGAVDAFVGALEVRPEDVESRAALAELYAAKGDRTGAVRELEIAARHVPVRAQTYRRLFELHQRAQRPDRAWLVATCLEELGASDVAHDLVVEQYRPEGAIRPTTALDPSWWDECLGAPGCDGIVKDILRAVGQAAIAQRLEDLAAKKKLPSLDFAAKHDKTSTVSVVRTFVWAARALGIPLPELYMLDEVPSGIAALWTPEPATAFGPQVRSGMTVQQLAFLAGRHLTYYLPEHYPLVFFPTLGDLSTLVLSAVRLVIPGISVPPPSGEGSAAGAVDFSGKLDDEQTALLKDAVARLDARGGKLDLLTFIRSVELTAARAGLLLTGDLRTALRLVKEETRAIGELTTEAKRGDLVAFCASEEYGLLRERMGVAIIAPTLPPSDDE
jgi:golgin subfamily B member 1